MGWFSNNFPTVARLFGRGNKDRSSARQSLGKGRRRARADEANQPETGDSAASIESDAPVGVAEGQTPAGQPSPAQPQPSVATKDEAAEAVEGQPSPVPPDAASPDSTSMQTGAGEAGDDAPAFTPATRSGHTSLAQLSATWVELEETIGCAPC